MATTEKIILTVETTVNAPIEKVWKLWTEPRHITQWNNASDDWYTPKAENDLKTGGKFLSRMEARDGSMGFDFEGTYDEVKKNERIAYTMSDGRKVNIAFKGQGHTTTVTETFEAENENPVEMQQGGWQSILDNFRKYVESSSELERMHFEIQINAKAEKVYTCMLDEKLFSEWTKEFNPSSYYKGSWGKGSKIVFLGADSESGETGGMVSRIKENIPSKFVSIEHLGIVQKGKEITSGPEVEGWAGAMEDYTFTEQNGKTLVSVDVDVNQEYKSYFTETWPKALNTLKALCEE